MPRCVASLWPITFYIHGIDSWLLIRSSPNAHSREPCDDLRSAFVFGFPIYISPISFRDTLRALRLALRPSVSFPSSMALASPSIDIPKTFGALLLGGLLASL